MKTIPTIILLTFALSNSSFAQAKKLDVAQLRAVPDGNYLVTVELNGKQEKLNLMIEGNTAKCVNSANPKLKNVAGEFQLHTGDPRVKGAFVARFVGGLGSQLWIFRSDGAAAIREIPDRGEQQSAVPVTGASLEAPKAK